MRQTPAHDLPNYDLLSVMPMASRLVEVGCSRGALAKAYKSKYPLSHYTGIEIDAEYGALAETYCDDVKIGNFEQLIETEGIKSIANTECWIFGDTLEHFSDPWKTLKNVRQLINDHGCVCACIPNMQHWSIQFKLNRGDLTYEDSGLLDRTHLRWFTRETICQLFIETGFHIDELKPRIFENKSNQAAVQLIKSIATQLGHNQEQAARDCLPLQYIVRASPA